MTDSAVASATFTIIAPPAVPTAPTGLTATRLNQKGRIQLSWNAVNGATSYAVKRSLTSGGPYTNVTTGVTSTSYTNTGLSSGVTYYYVVAAVNPAGSSGNSNQASATAK
jgi:fibronectin type 3 domain-containing protein